MLKLVHRSTLSAIAAFMLVGSAYAQFPDRNIQIIFPWGPGSSLAATQIIADAMGQQLGVNISVVSTPGAAGVKAFQTALDKPADGYTIIDGWVAPLLLQPQLGKADWTYKDFTPLWSATSTPFALVTRKNDSRWHDFPSFIAYMKKHPGELRYSSGTVGNIPDMVLSKVMKANGVYAQNIPYKQDGDAFKDLRGGLLDFSFNNPLTYRTNADAFKPIAIMNDRKKTRKLFDGAPLVKKFGTKLGLSGLAATGWNWFIVKKGTPDNRVKILRDAMHKALSQDKTRKKLVNAGFPPTLLPPKKYDQVVGEADQQIKSARSAISWVKKKNRSQ